MFGIPLEYILLVVSKNTEFTLCLVICLQNGVRIRNKIIDSKSGFRVHAWVIWLIHHFHINNIKFDRLNKMAPRENCTKRKRQQTTTYIVNVTDEPPHDNTNKMVRVPSEDSDLPWHPPSLVRVFAVRMKKAWVLSDLLSAERRFWSDWADVQADLITLLGEEGDGLCAYRVFVC